jgi:CDGSH-type Zn-finger protein
MSCLKEVVPNEPAIFPLTLELELGKEYFWCTCGKSKDQPFCDGYL